MTIDEAIKHYEELAEVNEDIANNCDMDNWMNKAGCEERASDYRQLAEWLTELKEAKRLLKQAVTDMNNGSCIANCYKCKHKENCDYSHRFEWEHTDEVDKLIGGSENDT